LADFSSTWARRLLDGLFALSYCLPYFTVEVCLNLAAFPTFPSPVDHESVAIMLDHAMRLGDLNDWAGAKPLFRRAEEESLRTETSEVSPSRVWVFFDQAPNSGIFCCRLPNWNTNFPAIPLSFLPAPFDCFV
jgi:hypothetical protein